MQWSNRVMLKLLIENILDRTVNSLSKPSKSERKEDRIQRLEKEVTNLKKKNAELQQQKTVQLNEEQLQGFLDKLEDGIEQSTNRIVDETSRTKIVYTAENKSIDGFSFLIKLFIGISLIVFSIFIGIGLFNVWNELWHINWINKMVLIISAVADFDCLILGVEILKEKDRNYIVSLFSALVALAALIVTLVK